MKLSDSGLKALHKREGLRLKPYLDTQGVPTIAMGNTYYQDGRKVKMTDKALTLEEAAALGNITAISFASYVNKYITQNVSQNQFDAVVSIAYNIGKTGFLNSTFLRKINLNPNDPIIAKSIWMWTKNEELKGRRKSEIKQYFDYDNASEEIKKMIDDLK